MGVSGPAFCIGIQQVPPTNLWNTPGLPMIGRVSRISAIIPATDRPATLPAALAAVRGASEPPDELIVIDEPAACGPAQARNDGARRASGEILVFVDADVAVHADAFARIRRAFEADSDLAAVFGSYDDDPARNGLVSDFRNLLHHHVHHQGAGPATTFWAGLGAIRREAFERVGGFDERRFPRPSVEDIDLGARLTARGARILLDPRIQGRHLKQWTLFSMVTTDVVHRGIPWVELMLSRRTPTTALNLGWRHRLSAAASLLLAASIVRRRSRGALAGVGALSVLNWPFYRLLFRSRGWRQAAVAIPLHAIHHLSGSAAVPAGLLSYLHTRLRRRSRRSRTDR
jgi:cellulose synthase/poly-beta-1,6-N-acetylglucosamine synthase-like glycosyltransferase